MWNLKMLIIPLVIITFYLVGRWLKDPKDKNPSLKAAIIEDSKNALGGLALITLIFVVISLLSKYTGWNSLSPEEQQKIEAEHQIFLRDLKHCQEVVDSTLNSSVIDLNNTEFQRCDSFLNDVYTDAQNSR